MKKLFKILLQITFIALLFSKCQADEIKFAFLTDTNINRENAIKIQETIKELNSNKNLDFIVFGGNNIRDTHIENLNIFCQLLKKTKKKTFVLLGNQDVLSSSGITKEYYLKKIRKAKSRHSKNPNYIFKIKDYIFIAMDGSKQYFKSTNGYYNNVELNWLDKTLTKYQDKNITILQHFPIIETNSTWLQTAKLENYYDVISKYKNIKAIVSGHYNINFEGEKQGFYNILTKDYTPNSIYRIIQIDTKDGSIYSHIIK